MNDIFSELVGLVYEGATEDKPWLSFGDSLRHTLDAQAVAITLHHSQEEMGDVYVMSHAPGDQTDWTAAEQSYRDDFMKADPYRPSQLLPGELVMTEAAQQPPSMQSFLERLGITHSLRACYAESGGMRCWIDVVWRLEKPGTPFVPANLELMRQIKPHINRALELYAVMKQQEAEKLIYASVVDHFALGCILLNERGEVIHINHIAASILGEWPNISIVRGRIAITERSVQRALDEAILTVIVTRSQDATPFGEKLVRLGNPPGKLLGLLVYPAPLAHYYRSIKAPSAIVHLSNLTPGKEDQRSSRPMPLAQVAQLFGLTRQESTLALLLAHGHTIVEAAKDMAIAETAARNYSKRIYAKTGVASQTELVRLMLRSLSFLR